MPGLYPERVERKIDYALMNREYPKLKAALTRAENRDDPVAVMRACERFVKVSAEVGCMPDDWSRWRNALEDAWNRFLRSENHYDDRPQIIDRFRAVACHFDY